MALDRKTAWQRICSFQPGRLSNPFNEQMVRFKDIAVRASVSVMTVSKALRDEPDVSEATKGRIKSLSAQMGYVPDSSAQGLRTRTTKLLGLLISSTTDPNVARMALSIEERAHDLGYDLLLMHTLNTV